MRIVIVRHAIAEDRDDFARHGGPDEARPLTARGRRRLRRAARALHRLVRRVDVLAASPLVRAHASAELLGAEYGLHDPPVTLPALAPDADVHAVGAWLGDQPADATIALVGHEPHLSRLIAWLVAGHESSFTTLTCAGACLLECDAPVAPGTARLAWLLRSGQLRRLR